MHDKSHAVAEQESSDSLFSESLTQLIIVGELPQSLQEHPGDNVSIHNVASLDEAEKHALHPRGDSEQRSETVQALVLKLDPDETQFEHYLGRAVRAFPHRILLHCTATKENPGRGDEAFFAFGFRKLPVAHIASDSAGTLRCFEYRLSQYKPAPDWLNARFWANPARFDVDGDLDDYDEEE